MSATILLGALLGGATHANLHPGHADLFVEVPEAGSLWEAYKDAPLIRMLGDEALAEALGPVLGEEDFDLQPLLEGALEEGDAPPELASLIVQLATDLDSFSVSIAGLGDDLRDRITAIEATEQHVRELRRLASHIDYYATEQWGSLPNALSEIPDLPVDVLADPWNGAYKYERTGEETYRLWSLGKDGEPGGRFENADLEWTGSEEAIMASIFLDGLHARMVFGFETKSTAESALGMAELAGAEWVDGLYGDEDLEGWVLQIPDIEVVKIVLMHDENRLTLDVTTQSPTAPPAWSETLADTEPWKRAMSTMESPSGTTIWQGFHAIAPLDLLEVLYHEEIPVEAEPLIRLGVQLFGEARKARTWRTRLDEGRFVKESFATVDPESPGVNAWLDHKPLDPEVLSWIPADTMGFCAGSIDVGYVFEHAIDATAQLLGMEKEELLAYGEEKLGVRAEQELVGGLGDGVVAVFDLAGLGPPRIRVMFELNDPEGYHKALKALVDKVGPTLPDEVSLRSKSYRKTDLFTLSFPGEQELIFLQPTLAVVDGRLLATVSASHARKEIKALVKGDQPEGQHPALARGVPDDARTLIYFDWGAVIGGVYDLGRTFGGMFAGDELPFDITSLPPGEKLAGYFPPTIGHSRSVDGGTYSRRESSVGPELLIVPAAIAGAVVLGARVEPQEVQHVQFTQTAPPVPARPAEADSTANALRTVRTGLAVYKLQHGAYPASLDDLSTATQDFPEGFLEGKGVPADGWGRSLVYRVEGDGYRLYSLGPDGADQEGSGDDVVADA